MKIILKTQMNYDEEDKSVVLTNDNLDNFNFVEMIIGDDCYDLPVEDFYRAFKLFEEIRVDVHKGNTIYDLIEAISGK